MSGLLGGLSKSRLRIAVAAMSASGLLNVNLLLSSDFDRVNALEMDWKTNCSVSYFISARDLFIARNAFAESRTNFEFQTFQLDLASGLLLKGCGSFDFDAGGDTVFASQADVVEKLASEDIGELKKIAEWRDLRARYARLLMLQRAVWVRLLDPSIDAMKLTTGYGVRFNYTEKEAAEDRARNMLNQRIGMNVAMRHFLSDIGPRIDRFMVTAFSTEPKDFRMLNELLAIGLYSSSNRAELVTAVERDVSGLPSIVKLQLP